ncbi:Uncharacterised protein [Mycobacteroides abscessus subsp. abscessus]|nr:Uncharacterised protein [Mycobacteroides abscessus subsp. abscessus]
MSTSSQNPEERSPDSSKRSPEEGSATPSKPAKPSEATKPSEAARPSGTTKPSETAKPSAAGKPSAAPKKPSAEPARSSTRPGSSASVSSSPGSSTPDSSDPSNSDPGTSDTSSSNLNSSASSGTDAEDTVTAAPAVDSRESTSQSAPGSDTRAPGSGSDTSAPTEQFPRFSPEAAAQQNSVYSPEGSPSPKQGTPYSPEGSGSRQPQGESTHGAPPQGTPNPPSTPPWQGAGSQHPPQGPAHQGASPYQDAPYQGAASQGSPYQGAASQGAPHPQQGTPYQGSQYPQQGATPQGIPYPTSSAGPSPRAATYLAPLARGATWKAVLIPPGIALAAGILVSIILTVVVMSTAEVDSASQTMGADTDKIGYALPFVLMALALFGSAAFRFDLQIEDFASANGALHLSGAPLLVTLVVLGTLWWFTQWSERRQPSPNRGSTWIRIGISALAFTIVLFLLQLIFAARFALMEGGGAAQFEFSAVTARSFFVPLLVIAAVSAWGRVAGHFKGTEAIGAPFLRWAVPPLLVAWVHLVVMVAVMSIVAIFVLPFGLDVPGQVVPLVFITMGLILTLLVHLGGVTFSIQGGFGSGSGGFSDSGTFSESLTIFSDEAPGQLWLGLLAVVVAVLAATLVATVTRQPRWTVQGQDPNQWHSAWRIPLAFAAVWGILSLTAIPMRASVSGSAGATDVFGSMAAGQAALSTLAWSFLVFAVWGGLIEVLSRTLGPRLALTMPAVTRFLAGRATHPHWGRELGMSAPEYPLIHRSAVSGTRSGQTPPPPPQTPFGPAGPQSGALQDSSGNPISQSAPGSASQPASGTTSRSAFDSALHAASGSTAQSASGAADPSVSGSAAQSAPDFAGPSSSWSADPSPSQTGTGSTRAWSEAGTYSGAASAPAQSAYDGRSPGASGGPAKPFDRKKATVVGVISGVSVLVIVAALIVVTQVNGRMFGPEAAVEKYLDRLADGDAEGALSIADVDVPAEQRQLLTNDVLGAAKALPTDITVADADVSDDQATVSATFDLGGSKSTTDFSLVKSGKTALFFDDWKLQSPELSYLAVETPGLTTVKVNGIDVDTDGSQLALPAFPALYEVGLAEQTELISADPIEARTFFAGSVDDADMEGVEPALLAAQPTDAFRSEVDKQVKTLIDSCAQKTVAQPDGCPFGSFSAESYDATNIKWSTSSYPTVTVADSSSDPYYDLGETTGPNGGPAWAVTSVTEGEAFVTGNYDSFFDDDGTFDDTVTFSVDGTAEIVDGKVVITINDGYGY